MRLRIATCLTLPEPDPDAIPLGEALAAAGFDADVVAWDDHSTDWDAAIPTILRSTWNYSLDITGFLAWCQRVSSVAPLWNPIEVVRANSHKRYLLDLAARDVPAVPTILLPHNTHTTPDELFARWDRIVIKPAVAAASLGARTFSRADRADRDAAHTHATEWLARGDVLVQPYLASIEAHGERSLIWIDGAITHAIRKQPRFEGGTEQITGPYPIADDERAVAEAALAPYTDQILYGRVDLARDADHVPRVMELELVEPSLFFNRFPPSAARYADGLKRRLRRPRLVR